MAEFYSARGSEIPPLPWTNLSPPFSHNGLGVPFPPLKERFELLEEAIQVCLQIWSTDSGPYDGKHYQLSETLNVPQCISKPHPPNMIGGSGEKKTLRLVAKYASACNLFTREGVDGVRHKLDVLRGHCDAENRSRTSPGGKSNGPLPNTIRPRRAIASLNTGPPCNPPYAAIALITCLKFLRSAAGPSLVRGWMPRNPRATRPSNIRFVIGRRFSESNLLRRLMTSPWSPRPAAPKRPAASWPSVNYARPRSRCAPRISVIASAPSKISAITSSSN